mgnify:CR=1 FL=1
MFTAFDYAAGSWRRLRWVIAKAEHSAQGANPQLVVTNVVGDAQKLYDRRYCAGGEMENRIKEQMMRFADRVSARDWWANQWRLLLSALAYTLMAGLRRLALAGTAWARATCASLRLKLVKVGAVIVCTASGVRVRLSSHHPGRDLFIHAHRALAPPRCPSPAPIGPPARLGGSGHCRCAPRKTSRGAPPTLFNTSIAPRFAPALLHAICGLVNRFCDGPIYEFFIPGNWFIK